MLMLCFWQNNYAQDFNPVTWSAELTQEDGQNTLIFSADIIQGWYLYSQEIGEDGPIPTSFAIDLGSGNWEEIEAKEESAFQIQKFDEMFQMDLIKYENQVNFIYPLLEVDGTIKARVEFMCCDDMQCLAPKTEELTINLK